MKRLLFMLLFTVSALALTAQDAVIVSGNVTDVNDVEMPGVTIFVEGTQQGTITNVDGGYEITAPSNGTLIFSFIGHRTEEILIGGQTTINIQLTETSFDMDEVVVVGYGSSTAKDLTGTIAVVKADELTKQAVPNIGQALQGKVAGIQVTNGGTPGSSPTIRIRGLGTVSSNPNPLYVVDGVFVNDISAISPHQIESVTVLKDASSAAIYGVRAANGVILITTKKGKSQKPEFTYSGYVGIQEVSNLLEMANKDQYLTLVNEKIAAGELRGTSSTPFDTDLYNTSTNWFEEVLNPAKIQNHNIGMSGGNEFATYYYGLGITSQEGLIKDNDYTRINLRGTSDITVNKFLKAGYGVTLNGWQSNKAANVYRQAYVAPPAFEPKMDNGAYTDPVILGFGNFGNPAASIYYHDDVDHGLNALANVYAELKPIENLSIRSSFTLDGTYKQNEAYTPEYWVSVTQHDTTTHLSKSNTQEINYTFDNIATYDLQSGDHHFKVMGGLSYVQFKMQGLWVSTLEIPDISESTRYISNGDDNVRYLSAGDKRNSYPSLIRSTSYFGRLFYSYKSKYLMTATLRRDGSSTFPSEERWGTFPSLGLGWVASSEEFMQNQEIFDFLKVKASWGVLGNNQVPQNAYTLTVNNDPLYSLVYGIYGSTSVATGASITSVVEPLLKWETVEEFDVGIEALLLNSKLDVDFDFYHRVTKNAIFPVPVLGTIGSGGSYLDNNADILNRGIELTLNWHDNVSADLSYSLGGNMSFNHNEVLKLAPGTLPFYAGNAYNGALATYTQLGRPIGDITALESDGVFQNIDEVTNYVDAEGEMLMPDAVAGDLRFVDQNEDGSIDELDRIPYGSYTPKFLYAFSASVNFRQFDFSIDLQGVAGNKILNAKRMGRYGNENYDADFAENRWHGEGTSTTYPSADVAGGMNAYPNSFFVESGAYFRIRNIQLGYTLPGNLTDKITSNGIRVYLSAQNPFTSFGYNGFSPEISGGGPTTAGLDYGIYPLSRITSAGVTINF
jgi:TonB-linked SusC/RagA family outer membrane protein